MTKKTLLNRKEYSTFQIVFGTSAWKDNIENEVACRSPKDKTVKVRQSLMVSVRKRDIEAETDARLRTIEEKKGNMKLCEKFKQIQRGDTLQYNRRGNKSEEQWRGPVSVLGIDGTVVIVRHGNRIVNAHMRHVRKFLIDDEEKSENSWTNTETPKPLMTNDEINNEYN